MSIHSFSHDFIFYVMAPDCITRNKPHAVLKTGERVKDNEKVLP